ncbi:DUF4870 family protein [Carnimonas nigrificans]|uniref:DUF4870 family protein n=1 Tax=Carnimonas nigrificans TaxID=64323 RepID=UPI00046ECC73|nr:hypothetical protein [Carnimonas nigrificans]
MASTKQLPPSSSTPAVQSEGSIIVPLLVYILYLVSLCNGVTAIIGVVIAYVYKGDAQPWQQQHYRFLIRTFWLSILYAVIGYMFSLMLVGFLVLALIPLWMIIRCIRGLKNLTEKRGPNNLTTWLY